MKLEEFEKLANAASREWRSGYVPALKHSHWQSVGPVTFGMKQAIVDADFTLACSVMVPKIIKALRAASHCNRLLNEWDLIRQHSYAHEELSAALAELEKP
jgi:hypothetical protein